MSKKQKNSHAYIDGANLHKGVSSLGWDLDYARFRVWLQEKYGVEKAYLFIGLIPKYKSMYTFFQECGFTLVFKEVVYDGDGKPKGNCDAELVLQATRDAYESRMDKAVLVSSDGDYSGLVVFLKDREMFRTILSPSGEKKCSVLLKRTGVPIVYLDDKRSILEVRNEKTPGADEPHKGSSRGE